MTREEKLNYCRVCTNRKLDLKEGLICTLTNRPADFEEKCENLAIDKIALQKLKEKIETRKLEEQEKGFFAPEKKGIKSGVLGGAVMIIIAVVWFFAGLSAGRIFFYPPVLFIFGIFAVVKGIATGNLAGEKKTG
jgi:hypothetical protein